ncbi:MAG: helix-turn-helix transcriptional regulator [Candidatus Omnitrophica bacterium]|nr:helix-turn-helix transcriptional regulator [Candidatus Omnitrophota bacterium]
MDRSWLWDKMIDSRQVKRIFKDEANPRFVELASLLLSRKNVPKEVFKDYVTPLKFCRNWQRIKKRMRQDNWNNPRIEFWQAIYEKLMVKYKRRNISVYPTKKKAQLASELSNDIAKIIIDMRKKKGFTQQQLAQITGFSQQMISRIEKGKQNISLTTLKKVADSLGCKVKINLV